MDVRISCSGTQHRRMRSTENPIVDSNEAMLQIGKDIAWPLPIRGTIRRVNLRSSAGRCAGVTVWSDGGGVRHVTCRFVDAPRRGGPAIGADRHGGCGG